MYYNVESILKCLFSSVNKRHVSPDFRLCAGALVTRVDGYSQGCTLFFVCMYVCAELHALMPHLRFLTLKYTSIFITFLPRLKTVLNISDSWVYLWPICWVWEKPRVNDKLCLQRLWGVQTFNMGRAIEYLWLSWACAKHMVRRNVWNHSRPWMCSRHNHSASRRSVASSWTEQQERCPSVNCWFPPFQVSIYALKL